MQEFTKQTYAPSDQPKDLTDSRVNRDVSDQKKISLKLLECSSFSPDPSLRNVANGIVAEECVNVRQYESVDQSIIEKWLKGRIHNLVQQKDKAITLCES